jgi:C4-dicarboxylate-specific signal transduction histidine kinase
MQQELSKTVSMEQIVSISDIVDEGSLVVGFGLENKGNITVIKNYTSLKPVKVDKVKLLQIIVNLLRNAKDSLLASSSSPKILTITTGALDNKMIYVRVEDNGLGISQQNMTRIFSYGFTTKHDGHGFGLHSSAISANEMGGSISVLSDGLGKGAAFILKLPYLHSKSKPALKPATLHSDI